MATETKKNIIFHFLIIIATLIMLFDDADEFEFLFVLPFEDTDSEQISIGSYFV